MFKEDKFLIMAMLAITVASVYPWTDLPLGNTFFWWFVSGLLIYSVSRAKKEWYDKANDVYIKSLKWYLLWNIICIARACFVASNYWEWKSLIGAAMTMLLPLSINISTSPFLVQKITSLWFRFVLPTFILFFPFFQGEAIGRFLMPISFLSLFLPFLNIRWRLAFILISIFVIISDLGARSNVIKFGAPILISSLYYFKNIFTKKSINLARITLLFLPFILFILAASGIFNIFKIGEYLSGNYSKTVEIDGEQSEENLMGDTRTFLYEEVISSAQKYEYVWFGRTPARGNETNWFDLSLLEDGMLSTTTERFSNEACILNVFTWTGVVGVILYFLIFFHCSYLAINKSNSYIMSLLGLYITFRWCYAWVEDISKIDLSNLYMWIIIGMCYSKFFRQKTDRELKVWATDILRRKRKRVDIYKKRLINQNA